MSYGSTIQSIRSTILHIRSKDAQQLQDGYNSNFIVNLAQEIEIDPDQECHVSISSVELPYSFYNISSEIQNNILYYNSTNITFTNQNYNIQNLVDFFNNDTAFSALFLTTFNRQTLKISFENITASNHTIKFSISNLNKVIGWDDDSADQIVNAGNSIASLYVVNLATIHSIMIHSNIGQGNVLGTRQGNSSTLQKVSCDVNNASIIYLNQSDFRQISITQAPVIDFLEFRITDQNNRLIQFNNVNYEFTMLFEIFSKFNNQRRIIQPINRATIGQAPQTLTEPDGRFTEPENIEDINDSHPIEGVGEIQHKTNRLILNELIDAIEKQQD
jgi:hypothetical protein|tara:strand:+ start:1340 stop:2332 length:993 start_codon:yes stop_codon:yes gene_type:complete